jgi:hypothetical protein
VAAKIWPFASHAKNERFWHALERLITLEIHTQYHHYQHLSGEDRLCQHFQKMLALRSNYENQHNFYHRWFVT